MRGRHQRRCWRRRADGTLSGLVCVGQAGRNAATRRNGTAGRRLRLLSVVADIFLVETCSVVVLVDARLIIGGGGGAAALRRRRLIGRIGAVGVVLRRAPRQRI